MSTTAEPFVCHGCRAKEAVIRAIKLLKREAHRKALCQTMYAYNLLCKADLNEDEHAALHLIDDALTMMAETLQQTKIPKMVFRKLAMAVKLL